MVWIPLPRRKHIRLPNYDYAQDGAYFVTVCLKPRLPLLGRIAEADVGAGPRPARTVLSPLGALVEQTWNDLPTPNPGLVLGPFIVMPAHVHGILILERRAGLGPAPTALPELMRQFKAFSSRRVNQLRGTPGAPLWQRGYYEHVIRNPDDFDQTAAYIQGNPARWADNRDFGAPLGERSPL